MDEKEREEFRKGKKRLFFWLKAKPIVIFIGIISFFVLIIGAFMAGANDPVKKNLGLLIFLIGLAGFVGSLVINGIYETRMYYFFVKSLEKVDKKLDITPDDLANVIKSFKKNPELLAVKLIDAMEKSEKSKTGTN